MNTDQLESLLGDTPWETFEARHEGDLLIMQAGLPRPVEFFMRVGTHFGRPMQAVMAEGIFLKLRSADQYSEHVLHTLDATKPETTLYTDANMLPYPPYPLSSFLWRPHLTKAALATTLQGQAMMQQAQLANQYSLQSGLQNVTYTSSTTGGGGGGGGVATSGPYNSGYLGGAGTWASIYPSSQNLLLPQPQTPFTPSAPNTFLGACLTALGINTSTI